MRRIIVAGNWKMNKTNQEVTDFFTQLKEEIKSLNLNNVSPIIAPPFIYLHNAQQIANDTEIKLSAQDISEHDFGAYTGEVSAPMLKSINVEYSIVGHSERREYHNEIDMQVGIKAQKLIDNGITPIICVGEKENEREMGMTESVILSQLKLIFDEMKAVDPTKIIIAYEPVWAIGTGKTATPHMAQEVHKIIRQWLAKNISNEAANQIPILYGGSVKPDNFEELLSQKDIDGGLIGGASLKIDDYMSLLNTATKISK
ncbi:MAG: triose-phosphate isomerase [Candidatus Cloacimonadia bacterium]